MRTYFIKESKKYSPFARTKYIVYEWNEKEQIYFELIRSFSSVVSVVLDFLYLSYDGKESNFIAETDQQYTDIQNALAFFDEHVKKVSTNVTVSVLNREP